VASAGDAREGEEQRWERQGATRGHVQKLEVELGCGIGGERQRQEQSRGGSGGARGRRSREVSGELVCNSQKVQGPLCKLKFLTATKVK
jgi:hypothetical protein